MTEMFRLSAMLSRVNNFLHLIYFIMIEMLNHLKMWSINKIGQKLLQLTGRLIELVNQLME